MENEHTLQFHNERERKAFLAWWLGHGSHEFADWFRHIRWPKQVVATVVSGPDVVVDPDTSLVPIDLHE
jgi:hypothetical protein